VKPLQKTPTVSSDVEGGADPADGHSGRRNAGVNFYFSVNLLDYYMIPCRLFHRKLGDPHLRGLVVGFVLWDISLQERQECASLGRRAAAVVGGGGRSGSWLRRIVLGEFQSEVGEEKGPRVEWERRTLYGTEMVIGGLGRLGMGFEVDGRVKTREVVPLALGSMS